MPDSPRTPPGAHRYEDLQDKADFLDIRGTGDREELLTDLREETQDWLDEPRFVFLNPATSV